MSIMSRSYTTGIVPDLSVLSMMLGKIWFWPLWQNRAASAILSTNIYSLARSKLHDANHAIMIIGNENDAL